MNKQKPVIYKIGIICLSLYSVVLMIYFLHFYKPFKPIPDESYEFIKATNDMLRSTHRESIIFFLIFSLMLCIVVSLLFLLLYTEIAFYFKPTTEKSVIVKSKEAILRSYSNPNSASAYGYSYWIVFETTDGEEIKLPVLEKHFIMVFQGNKGILKYKQGMSSRFVSFDITSIDEGSL